MKKTVGALLILFGIEAQAQTYQEQIDTLKTTKVNVTAYQSYTAGMATTVVRLDTALAGKAPLSHRHTASDITDLVPGVRAAFSVTGTGASYDATTGQFSFTAGGNSSQSFSASDLTSGTLPDARLSTNVVDLTRTQTLTNKTLTAPVINAPTGLVKGDVGLPNVPNVNTLQAISDTVSAATTNLTFIGATVTTAGKSTTVSIPGGRAATVDNVVNGSSTNAVSGSAVTSYVTAATAPLAATFATLASAVATDVASLTTLVAALTAQLANQAALIANLQTQINGLASGSGSTTASAATPAAPTTGVADDIANTFDWTNSITSGLVLADYQYTVNGGMSYATVTVKPLTVGDSAKAIGQVGVRVGPASGRNASATLYNGIDFTVASVTLAAPATLTATALSASQIAVEWSVSTSATGYSVQFSTASDFSVSPTSLTTTTTSLTVTVMDNTTYYFRVRATAGAGFTDSPYSTTAAAKTPATAWAADFTVRLSLQANTHGQATAGWNRLQPTSAQLTSTTTTSYTAVALLKDTGGLSGWTATIAEPYTFAGASSITATPGSVYPQSVMQSAWFVSAANTAGGKLAIYNLNQAKYYQVYILGAGNGKNVAKYTVTGTVSASQSKTTTANSGVGGGAEFDPNAALAVFLNVRPNLDGKIFIETDWVSGSQAPTNAIILRESTTAHP